MFSYFGPLKVETIFLFSIFILF